MKLPESLTIILPYLLKWIKGSSFPWNRAIVIAVLSCFFIINSQSVRAQSSGDYRSVASGNWNNPAIWQTYNGVSWVPASSAPGLTADAGTVQIMNNTTVTLNVNVNGFTINELIIGDRSGGNDTLLIPDNGEIDLNVNDLIVEVDGILEWEKNGNIYLPAGSRVINQGGTISTSKSCNASQVIYIGTDKFSTCNGNGGSDYSFEDLEESLPPPNSDGDLDECAENPIQTLTASATPPQNAYVVWYANETGGSEVSPTWNTIGTTTYWAESVDDVDSSRRSIFRTPVQLTLRPSPTISVSSSPTCNLLTNTYSLEVTVSGGTVSSTDGTVTDLGGNEWRVSNVPDGTDIVVTVTETNGCTADLQVTSPNCGCPVVNAPNSDGDVRYCEGDPIPALSVTVGPGETADWYDAASGGTLLQVANTDYTPASTGVYYAEARNQVTGCVSSSRTAISLSEDTAMTVVQGGDQTVFSGDSVIFSGVSTGADTYQWEVSEDNGATFQPLSDNAEYSGTTTPDLQLAPVDLDKQGYLYRLEVSHSTSACPAVTSNSARLNIRLRTLILNRNVTKKVTN